MDTSEQYIKMCEEAGEIQGLALPLAVRKSEYQSTNGADMSKRGDWWHLNTWLPRQDQLQEIVFTFDRINPIHFDTLFEFVHYIETVGYGDLVHIYSMEQLWLAFVMKEKWGKVWDGKNWTLSKVAVG